MIYRPVAPYMHDGHKLHPKLSYALPVGMGEELCAMRLFVAEEGEADVDLSGMPWQSIQPPAGALVPEPLAHLQSVS